MALTENYRKALKALQGQATAAVMMLPEKGDKKAGKVALREAQQQMAEVDREVRHIYRLVMIAADPDLTIPALTEEGLERLLAAEHHAVIGSTRDGACRPNQR